MMHVFHFRGFKGLMKLVGGFSAVALALIAFPSAFMMIAWNAIVFEVFEGPEANLIQGFLMWCIALTLVQLIFRPQIQFQFKRLPETKAFNQDAYTKDKQEESKPNP